MIVKEQTAQATSKAIHAYGKSGVEAVVVRHSMKNTPGSIGKKWDQRACVLRS